LFFASYFQEQYQYELRIAAAIIASFVAFFNFWRVLTAVENEDRQFQARVLVAEQVAEREPERTKPAWDVTRVTLEAYFRRNLLQLDMIFTLSVTIMVCGFGVMLWGVTKGITAPTELASAGLVTGAGVITEIIGGTFLVVYKSAIQQAIKYTSTLERLNSVGLALQILDTMNDSSEKKLRSETKAEVVKLLVSPKKAAEKPRTLRLKAVYKPERDSEGTDDDAEDTE